jgi:hypothetical protein
MIEHVIDMMTWIFSFQVSDYIRWWTLIFLMIEHVIDMMTWIFTFQTWETNHKTNFHLKLCNNLLDLHNHNFGRQMTNAKNNTENDKNLTSNVER